MSKWPKDNQAALIRFYGDPGKKGAVVLVRVIPPFQMFYAGKPIKSLSFHKKAAPALRAALNQVWEYYGRDQEVIDSLGISKTAGTYNPRKIRGSKTKWSNHAYGAAIDINAEENGFNVAGNIPLPMIAAFKAQGFKWGGDYKGGRKDPMHFEAVDSGEPQRTFEQWLDHYKVRRHPTEVSSQSRTDGVRGDPEVWHVQRRLKAMNYNPGDLDGRWGGNTSGALAGFVNDRAPDFAAPTSPEMFRKVLPQIKAELAESETETPSFKRPVSVERAGATAEELAPKFASVSNSASAEKTSRWGAIGLTVTSIIGGVARFAGDAVEALRPVTETVKDIDPGWLLLGVVAVAAAMWGASRYSKKAAQATVSEYQEGSIS
jgi:hypothetical protein